MELSRTLEELTKAGLPADPLLLQPDYLSANKRVVLGVGIKILLDEQHSGPQTFDIFHDLFSFALGHKVVKEPIRLMTRVVGGSLYAIESADVILRVGDLDYPVTWQITDATRDRLYANGILDAVEAPLHEIRMVNL